MPLSGVSAIRMGHRYQRAEEHVGNCNDRDSQGLTTRLRRISAASHEKFQKRAAGGNKPWPFICYNGYR